MEYKISIHGKNFYKEIELSKDWSKGLLIGTTKECQMRFSRETFDIEFVIQILSENGQWKAVCDRAVCLKKQDSTQVPELYLTPLNKLRVCNSATQEELFTLEFAIDFLNKTNDFDKIIACQDAVEFSVGGVQGCTIRLTDPVISGDYIKIIREEAKWLIDSENARYGILINGFPSREKRVQLNERDMITINGFSFYWSKRRLFTSVETEIITQFPVTQKLWQKNHLQYPKFVRSARQQFVIPREKVDILSPKSKPEEPKKNLVMTMVPMLVSMGMMVMMRMSMGGNIMFAIMCAGMGVVSAVMAVVNYRSEGKQYKKNIVKRENDYNRYIAEQEEKIQELRTKERIISAQKYPSLEEELGYVEDFNARLFEKQKVHEDYLWVRIGEGTVPSQCEIGYKKQEYREVEDPLMDYPEKLNAKYYYIENMPVILDLSDANAVGFLGDRTHLYQMTKNLILQFGIEHYHQDVKLYLLMGKEDKQYFEWARWFRNFREENGMRNFGYDENSSKSMLEYLYAQLSEREKLKENDIKKLPTNIVFIYRSELLGEHPVSNYLENASKLGFVFLFFEEYVEMLNPHCSKRVFLHSNDYTGYVQDILDGEQIQHFRYSRVPVEKAMETAMKMACVYVDEVSLEASLTKNITLYQLLGIMNVYDLNLAQRWANSKIYDTMAAPLGVKSGDEIVYLDLHEKYHGPHGLVAGTTGSGKSEILQSYILSMATLFHPYEVGFIIIDFKGGGMVNQFRNLPHLNGAITNIDGKEINRSLSSIKAELRKRQRLFAEYEVNHINDYIRLYKQGKTAQPLPHLILIVDEFAELKSDQPEFMKELISAARIGRSLGVHLILATQKPSGVVNDQIWSNSKFKLCLKVQNQSDSNEVLKSPLAAEIREPGRAYLQVGNNEIFQLFQSAYSGAPVPNGAMGETKKFKVAKVGLDGRREVVYEQKPKEEKGGDTQLDAIVEYVAEQCKQMKIEKLPDICLPPLPEILPYSLEAYESQSTDICVPIGLYDDPDNQQQVYTGINLTQSHLFILGSAQYGKTNLLQTIIRGVAEKYSPSEVNIYILDFASMLLKSFEALRHVGGVITENEDEKLKNLVKMITVTIAERKEILSRIGLSSFSAYREAGYKDMPQIILMIDNVTALKEQYPEVEESLSVFCREGLSVGVEVIATNPQSSGMGFRFLTNFAMKIALNCFNTSEYTTIFQQCRITPASIPGRGIIQISNTCYECQTFLAFEADREIEKVNKIKEFVERIDHLYIHEKTARLIPDIPTVLTKEYLWNQMQESGDVYDIPIGINFADTKPYTISLDKAVMLGIVGKDSAERTQFIRYILDTLLAGCERAMAELYIADSVEKMLLDYRGKAHVAQYSYNPMDVTSMIDAVYEIIQDRYQLLLEGKDEEISNLPLEVLLLNAKEMYSLISTNKNSMEKYRKLVTQFKVLKVCVILADVENAAINFSSCEMLKMIKDEQTLIMFENINELKVVDIGAPLLREFKKKLGEAEAYVRAGSNIIKLKTPTYVSNVTSHSDMVHVK